MGQLTSPAIRRFWIILWALAVVIPVMLLAATLAARPVTPEALRHFDTDLIERGRRFSEEIQIAGTVQVLVSLGVMLLLCFHPLGAGAIRRLETMGRGRLWGSLITVCAGITLITGLVELPFSYYIGYVHEKAYGLTHQTPQQWLSDHATGLLMHLGLSLVLWIPLYYCIRRWPRRWWIPAAVLNVAVSGLLVVLAPILLVPLQGKLVPVRDPAILAMVQRLADRAGVKVEKVQMLMVSEKSTRVNAMVTGLGPTKQVIVYNTLLKQFTPDEVEVVMAHELSHAAHNDVTTGWLVSAAVDVGLFITAAWVLKAMVGVGALRLPQAHSARGLAVFVLLVSLTSEVTGPFHNYLSRQMEVRADQFAIDVTHNPRAFISGFKKLAKGNPGDVDPPALVEWLSHSHPSIMNRLRLAVQAVR